MTNKQAAAILAYSRIVHGHITDGESAESYESRSGISEADLTAAYVAALAALEAINEIEADHECWKAGVERTCDEIPGGKGECCCSVCGHNLQLYEYNDEYCCDESFDPTYCPGCGAKIIREGWQR